MTNMEDEDDPDRVPDNEDSSESLSNDELRLLGGQNKGQPDNLFIMKR